MTINQKYLPDTQCVLSFQQSKKQEHPKCMIPDLSAGKYAPQSAAAHGWIQRD